MQAGKVDYYAVLGLARKASADEIRGAYKRMALQWHPDKNPTQAKLAEDKFKQISEAYQILSDPAKRGRYDAGDLLFDGRHEGYTDAQDGHSFRFAEARDLFGNFARTSSLFSEDELSFLGLQRAGRGSGVRFSDDFFSDDFGGADVTTTHTSTRRGADGRDVRTVKTTMRRSDGSISSESWEEPAGPSQLRRPRG